MPSYWEEQIAQQQARSQQPASDITDQLVDLIGRGASTALEAAMPILDFIGRPQTALSEAYGAYKDGEENELLAAYRGLSEGREGALYPTFGEQLVPYEEGEGLGRMAGRFGVDLVTDPTNLLFFTGAGRSVIGKGLEKIATPALKKTAEVIKRQPWAQGVGRYTVRPERLWSMFGDSAELGIDAGTVGGKAATEGMEATGIRFGKVMAEQEQNLSRFGVGKDTAKRKELYETLQGQASTDGGVTGMKDWMRLEYDRVAADAKQHLDMWDPASGKFVPWRHEENYTPLMLKRGIQDEIDKFLDTLPAGKAAELAWARSGPKMTQLQQDIAKKMNITKEQAGRIVDDFAGRPRTVGHIEVARTQFPPELEQFLEKDPVELFSRYMERTIPRIEMAKRFGKRLEKLTNEAGTGLLDESVRAGMLGEIATDIQQMIKGVTPRSRFGMDDKVRGALAIQTMGKLGPTTSLMNWGQHINTAVKEGIGKMFRGVGTELQSAERKRWAFTYVSGLRDHMRMMTGEAAGSTALLPRMAQGWLKGVGFTLAESSNRIGAASAGLTRAKGMGDELADLAKRKLTQQKGLSKKQADRVKYLEKTIKEYGVPEKELDNFLRMRESGQAGKFSPDTEDLVGFRASQVTQHATSPWELPPAWRTPEMRLFLQFKRFAYNQSRFLYNEVAKPGYKWLETNGVEGDIAPLVRSLALFPPAGVALGTGREGIKDLQAWFVGAKRRPSQYDFDNHPTASTLRGMMYVGSFGVAGDLMERAFRSGMADYFLGPTVSDAFDMFERLAKSGYKMTTEGETPTIEDMFLNLYRVGGRGALGLSPSELTTAGTSRGLPGVVEGAIR